MNLTLVGINHNTAPLEVREKACFDNNSLVDDLRKLKVSTGASELAVLNTCNRTEVYFHCNCEADTLLCRTSCLTGCSKVKRTKDMVVKQLHENSQLQHDSFVPFLYEYQDNEMIRHVMRVASGLNSMVLGEPQILGQLKTSFQYACKAGTVKDVLYRLFQHTFTVAKRVRTETGIGTKPVSVAYTVVKLIRQFYSNLGEKKILLVGAGDTIKLVSQHLKQHSANNFVVANRTTEKALKLVQGDHNRVVDLHQISNCLEQVDVVICSTSHRDKILTTEQVKVAMKKRPNRRMLIIDLAVPRDVEQEVSEINQVYLYCIDDLRSIIEESLMSRHQEVQHADEIIRSHQSEFTQWLNLRKGVSAILQIRQQGEEIRQQLLQKAIKKIDRGVDTTLVLEQLSRQMKNYFLHVPTITLRDAIEKENIDAIELISSLYQPKNN